MIELTLEEIENAIMDSYHLNNKNVKSAYSCIKEILLEVAKKRGIDIKGDETFDIDEILNEIVEIPKELEDFNPIYFKSKEQLQNYVDSKTEDMTSEEIEIFLIDYMGFNGIGGLTDSFRGYMAKYIPGLVEKIGQLKLESINDLVLDESIDDLVLDNSDDNSDDIGEPISEYSGEDVWGDLADFEGFIDTEVEFADNGAFNRYVVTDDELCNYIRYINIYPKLIECKTNGIKIGEKLVELANQKKLKEFYSDQHFMEEFKKIMTHDRGKHTFYFHGTQDLESAASIMQEGLGMMRKSLSTTSYPELTINDVILYSRGLSGEIGKEAIVIIDRPITENGKPKEIVEPINSKKIHFIPSGLQGLNGKPKYIVDPKYIVGYVDKRNKAIIYNPRYYEYNKQNDRPNGVPYSNGRITDGVLDATVVGLTEISEEKGLQQ